MNTAQFITIFTGANYAAGIYATYEAYVLADAGILEGKDCTINAIAALL